MSKTVGSASYFFVTLILNYLVLREELSNNAKLQALKFSWKKTSTLNSEFYRHAIIHSQNK